LWQVITLALLRRTVAERRGNAEFAQRCCLLTLPWVLLLLSQIYGLRELHEELAALFSQEEASSLGLAAVLAPFARLPALHVSSYTAAAWDSAHSEHERRLEAVEERVSQKLKELFGEFSGAVVGLRRLLQQRQAARLQGYWTPTD
jgi:hypothetical protein